MVLSEATQDYLQFARHELVHSPPTVLSYQSWLRKFARWLDESGTPDPPVREISVTQIRRYSYSLSGRNLRPRTVRGALNALRAMFTYLVDMGALATNPAREVRMPKKDAATRLLVMDEDLVKLLEAAERQRTDFRCICDRAVLSVLIFCELRRQELLDLTIHALKLEDQSLLVQQGKTTPAILLCLTPQCGRELQHQVMRGLDPTYLSVYHPSQALCLHPWEGCRAYARVRVTIHLQSHRSP
ncbi:MAG TPA: phage integrase N-terminal SAM-like domain-containing protein [Armatimonadota bacterium]|nr:phage integrase N-terminal SAM-like domain-containing protein [Armatimonadota bacterium]